MPVTAIVNRLSALVKLLEIHNITGVFVFDGEKHKRKKVSDIRATTVENAIKKMKAIQKCVVEENGGVATESQYKQYQAAAKQAAKPRLFDIAYAINYLKEAGKTVIVGAYEADFQLVQLYTTGEIDFIISVDLDYFIYDCILMADLSINTGKCVILHRENMDEYWKQLSKRQLFLLALLSGCDYYHISKSSTTKVYDYFNKIVTCGDDHSAEKGVVTEFIKCFWENTDSGGDEMSSAAVKIEVRIFYNTLLFFSIAPTFSMNHDTQSVSLTTLKNEPITQFTKYITDSKPATKRGYEEAIGFTLIRSSRNRQFIDIYYGVKNYNEDWKIPSKPHSETGVTLSTNPNHPQYEYGTFIEFDINDGGTPISLNHPSLLSTWLKYRGLHIKSKDTNATMIPLIRKCLESNQPVMYHTDEEAYTATLPYLGVTTPISWKECNNESDFDIIKDKIKNIMKLNIDSFNSIFGEGKNGVRDRAYTRLVSGHYHIKTLKVAMIQPPTFDDEVIVFNITVTPSCKNGIYMVDLFFEKKDGSYIQDSTCDCPNSKLFCSHMIGVLLIFYILQQNNTISYDNFVNKLPTPNVQIRQLPIDCQNIMGKFENDAKLRSGIAKQFKQIAQETAGYSIDVENVYDNAEEVDDELQEDDADYELEGNENADEYIEIVENKARKKSSTTSDGNLFDRVDKYLQYIQLQTITIGKEQQLNQALKTDEIQQTNAKLAKEQVLLTEEEKQLQKRMFENLNGPGKAKFAWPNLLNEFVHKSKKY